MTFNRIPEITALITRIDSAMARADGAGNDAMRSLMPELREAIDDVNAALREVDALLFQGLRDEAIGLHEEEFPALAARLNLEDREEWPELERFLVVAGVGFPPKIDFDTLSSLESAHAELEGLRRPLDRLRRMALERAPVAQRLSVLRELRRADSTKPVWTQAIKDHEQARVAELHQEVRRVLATRDPQAIATVHAELVNPDWGIPIPRDLIRATRGADLWMTLRSAAGLAREAGKGLEAGWQELQQSAPTPELVERLRGLRSQYDQAGRLVSEVSPRLAECPTMAGLVQEERLVEQIEAVASRVAEPLHWLANQDAADAVAAHFQQLCGQLEYLCGQTPTRAAESAWLAEVRRIQGEAEQISSSHAGLAVSPELQERLTAATAAVFARAGRRRQLLLAAVAAGVVAAGLLVFMIAAWWRKGAVVSDDLHTLESLSFRARAGEFAELPEEAASIVRHYSGDDRFARVANDIEGFVREEADRREKFRQAIAEIDRSVDAARNQLEARNDQDRQLEAWPGSVVEGARAWRRARELGGEPGKRQSKAGGVTTDNAAVDELQAAEEEELGVMERMHKDLVAEYENAAATFVKRKNNEFLGMVQGARDPEEIRTLRQAIEGLLEAVTAYDRDRQKILPELLEKPPGMGDGNTLAKGLITTRNMLED